MIGKTLVLIFLQQQKNLKVDLKRDTPQTEICSDWK